MASSIDPTKPVRGTPTTRSVRDNFKAAKEEIETLQAGTSITDIDLGTTTVTGTTAQFNAALSDDDFATLTNNVTLQNKNIDLDSNTLTGAKAEFNSAVQSDTFVFFSDYNANTLLAADTNNTPTARTISEQEVVGRLTGGNITGLPIGIADDDMVQVDGSPNDDEYARWTANGLEGRTEAEFKSDFNLEIGTDVQAHDAGLDDISGLAVTDGNFIVGDGNNWVAESGNTAVGEAINQTALGGAPAPTDRVALLDVSDDNALKYAEASTFGSVSEVATLSDLKALSANQYDVVITQGYTSAGDGGGGAFRWDGSDLSTEVTNDPGEGVYAPPDSDATGASGAWVRLHNGILSSKHFGTVNGAGSDNETAFQNFLDYLAANGGGGVIPPGAYGVNGELTLTNPANGFSVYGAGMGVTTLIKLGAAAENMIDIEGADGVHLSDFTLDCDFTTHADGDHGILLLKCDRSRVRRVEVIDQKNTGILVTADGVIDTHEDVWVEDCLVDGEGTANNGILVTEMLYSGIRRCYPKDCAGSPGYGLQLKNQCKHSAIEDSVSVGCTGGVAFASDAGNGPSQCRVSNVGVRNPTNVGCALGDAVENSIDGLLIDMGGAGNEAVNVGDGADQNVIDNLTAVNVAAGKEIVRFRDTAEENFVRVTHTDKTSNHVGFDLNSANNRVELNFPDWATTIDVRDDSGNTNNRAFLNSGLENETFKATQGSAQSIPSGAVTKIEFDAEVWDPRGDYDNATNYEYNPSVPGIYTVMVCGRLSSLADGDIMDVRIYKNGSATAIQQTAIGAGGNASQVVSALIDMDGDTDTLSARIFHNNGMALDTSTFATFFTAHRVGHG